jgi:ribonuclease P protein component
VRVPTSAFVLLLHVREPSDGLGTRLGIVASRKVGIAVVRNREKRLVREWFRRRLEAMSGDHDLVVILRTGAPRHAAALWPALDGAYARARAEARRKSQKKGPEKTRENAPPRGKRDRHG